MAAKKQQHEPPKSQPLAATKTAPTKPARAGTTPAPGAPAGGPGDLGPVTEVPGASRGNAAAPLVAPVHRGPTGDPIGQHVAVGAVLDERHIGIVDEDGQPVDLAAALVRGTEVGSIRYATQRIYEETTLPGTEATRRKLLFGENATVPEQVYEQLCAAMDATATARAAAR